jgi:uncharacterized sulfatase
MKYSRIYQRSFLFAFIFLSTINAQEKPNVLFIAFDDLRPLIGAYGEPEPLTPNIDALASEAARFNKAYVSYPLCSPSRAAMLTGVRFDNQVWVDGKKVWTFPKMIQTQDTWPRVLRENGYWTATKGKLYHGNVPGKDKSAWDIPGTKSAKNFHDGGPEIEKRIVDIGGNQEQIDAYLKKGAGPAALMYASIDGPDDLLNDGKTANTVIDYIKSKRDKSKPFAISCGFSRPHMPWVAPKKYFDLYPKDAGKLAYMPKGATKDMSKEVYKGRYPEAGWNEGVSDEVAKKLIRGYMASTTYADAQMGKVIKALKEEGLYDNTIIVMWGDHGYHLTDHGKWRKNTGYNVSLRSPLIIKTPHNKKAQVIENIVQNIDIYPTLLELLNIKKPDSVTLHGNSLVPLLNNENVNWEDIAYTCAVRNFGLVTDRYRFTKLEDGGYRLFDLKEDPQEWNNLAENKEYKELISEFEAKLETVVWNKPE